MAYFNQLPKTQFLNQTIVNLAVGVKLNKLIKNDAFALMNYSIQDGESPDTVAFNYYDDPAYAWLVLLSNNNGKVFISCFISKNLVDTKGFNAAEIIKELSPLINGSGGGQAFYASGGGSNLKGISSVISKSEEIVNQI